MNRPTLPLLRLAFYLMVLGTISGGCSEQTRYHLLTIFFTGVPPLDQISEAEEETIDIQRPRRQLTQTSQQFYSHPLWANGVCDPCHLTTSTFTVPGVSSRASSRFKTGGGIPGKLVRPQNMICLRCHTDKLPLRALSDNLWLHNTTAKGDCLECHSQHQSEYPHVLKKQGTVICFPCHEKGKYLETPVHQQAKSCLDCHNPHMGKNRNLLTSEFKEIKVPVTDVPGHPELRSIPAEVGSRDSAGVRER